MKKGIRLGTVFFLLVATAFITAIGTYFYISVLINDLGKNQQMYTKLNKINEVVTRNYILTIDPIDGYTKILDGTVEGYVNGLNDPYSYYLNEKNYKTQIQINEAARDIGIRAAYDKSTSNIRVDFVKRGSPAEQAGLQKDDIITAIDGVSVTEVGYRRAVQSLSGEEGSTVVLNIIRAGDAEAYSFAVTRFTYEEQTLEYRMLDSSIGYLFVEEFGLTTPTEVTVALDELRQSGARGFIFDVRFNSGGDLSSAVSVLDKLMPTSIVVSLKYKNSDTPESYYSDERHIDEPIVVIQNGETSDVAEVFSAALRDTGIATLVGVTSKGVGVGQTDIPLSDGTALHLSTYEYVTASGETFNQKGIEPNYISDLDAEKEARFFELTDEEDSQLQTALESLKEIMGTR